tara:strand:+ start:443 stop:604 length:162 start_codon:yes stop_codon:yes gene_type:complete
MNFQGRHAVVTGAAQGFGLAITTRMAAIRTGIVIHSQRPIYHELLMRISGRNA